MHFNENKAIFLQIADRIADRVLSGELTEEQRVASVRTLAAESEVNVNTVMRAYEHLSSLNILYNKRGIGFFVSTGARQTILDLRRQQFLSGELPYLFGRLHLLGIDPAELKLMYTTYLNQNHEI